MSPGLLRDGAAPRGNVIAAWISRAPASGTCGPPSLEPGAAWPNQGLVSGCGHGPCRLGGRRAHLPAIAGARVVPHQHVGISPTPPYLPGPERRRRARICTSAVGGPGGLAAHQLGLRAGEGAVHRVVQRRAGAERSTSPRSGSGYETQSHDRRDTLYPRPPTDQGANGRQRPTGPISARNGPPTTAIGD